MKFRHNSFLLRRCLFSNYVRFKKFKETVTRPLFDGVFLCSKSSDRSFRHALLFHHQLIVDAQVGVNGSDRK